MFFFCDGIIWFPFNQTSGLTTLDAGGAFTGILAGFNNDPTEWVAGKWNRAVDFNGVGNFVTISNYNGILGASNRTCAAWVKTTSTGSMPVIAWGPNSTGNKWTFLLQNGHPRIEVTSGFIEGVTLVNDDQWHHVAVTFANDGTPDILEAKLYVDGVAESSFTTNASRTLNTTSSGEIKIGSDVQNRFFLGQIDEPRIYPSALSATEVAALTSASNQSAAAWQRRYFGAATANWLADDDGDGGARLLEYAFGSQPWIADRSAHSLTGEVVGGHLRVRFPRRPSGSSELVYSIEASRDLIHWGTLATALVSATPLPGSPGLEQAVFETDATVNEESAQFVRVAVMLP